MSEIKGINQSQDVTGPNKLMSASPVNSQMAPQQPPPPPVEIQFSPFGKLFQAAGDTNDELKQQLRHTIDTMIREIRTGHFNPESFSDKIPDAVKQLAINAGIDLKAAISKFSEEITNMDKMGNIPPPPGNRPPQGPHPMIDPITEKDTE